MSDGVTTQDLNTAPVTITKYTPHTEARTSPFVVDTFIVDVSGIANGQTLARAIEQFFMSARRRFKLKIGAQVYLNFKLQTADSYWRSEIIDGTVDLIDDAYHYDTLGGYVQLEVSLTRRNYWEQTNEVTVNTFNAVSASSSIQQLFNMSNVAAVRNNYVRILAASIVGDVESPLHIEMTNNFVSATRMADVWIGHLIERNGTLDGVVEMEGGTYYNSTAAVVAAGASGGNYVNLAWSGASSTVVWDRTLSTAFMNAAMGVSFRVLAFTFAAGTAGARIRARITMEGLHEKWFGPWVSVGNSADVLDLGEVQIPTGLIGSTSVYPLRIELQGWNLAGGSNVVPVDYLMFMPTDGFRFLHDSGFSTAQNVTLVDNTVDMLTYTTGWATPGRADNYVPEGKPIMLVPGMGNALYFMMRPAAPARTMNVIVSYRPRRLTI